MYRLCLAWCQLAEEPGLGHFQVPVQCSRRDVESGSAFVVSEAAKEEKFDDRALSRVDGSQALERLIEFQQIERRVLADDHRFVECDHFRAAPAFLAIVGSGVVDENVAHNAGGDGVELYAVVPFQIGDSETQVGFVNKRGGAESVAWTFRQQTTRSKPAELVVDERHQFVTSLFIPAAQFVKKPRNLLLFGRHSASSKKLFAGMRESATQERFNHWANSKSSSRNGQSRLIGTHGLGTSIRPTAALIRGERIYENNTASFT